LPSKSSSLAFIVSLSLSGLQILYLLTTTLAMVHLTTQIIVYGMCHCAFPYVQLTALVFLLHPVNAHLHLLQPATLRFIIFGVVATNYLTWVLSAIHQITTFLKIKCLSIPYSPTTRS
jgi:hypothetical protein